MKAESKYKGSLKLAAIGDALGWMTEFEKSQDTLKKKFGTDYINSFHDWEKNVGGRFYGYIDKLNSGSYSDDTQLLLSVARSINKDGFIDQQYFAKKELPDWLLYSRGAGRTVKNAARKIQRKSVNWNNNFYKYKIGKTRIDYRECGANGAAMRVLPIALANFNESEKIKEEIFKNSIITHGHPRAIIGAILYGYCINNILNINPDNFNKENFLTSIGKNMHENFSLKFLEKPELKSWEKEWNKNSDHPFEKLYNETISETQNYLRTIYKRLKEKSSDFETLKILGCYDNQTRGSGTSTVLASIYLLCNYYKKPLKAIEVAVNSIGTDTDSIAAFSGGLIGALHGQSIIPSKWKKFQDNDYIERVAEDLLKICYENKKTELDNNPNNLKSLSIEKFENIRINDTVYINCLGEGKVIDINKQDTLISNKYNLIIDVEFQIGQSCRFSKLIKNPTTEKKKENSKQNFQTKLF